jgi:hypothetical protein
MATGKPVVSVHATEADASNALNGYPLWFPVTSVTAESVRDVLIAAGKAARTITPAAVAAGRAHAQVFRRDVVLAAMEAELREAIRA